MDTYMMMLYVSLDQEKALKQFFLDNGWAYCKPDLSVVTDSVGPLVAQTPHTKKLPASQRQKETTEKKSTPCKTGSLHNYSIAQTEDNYVSEVLFQEETSSKKRKLDYSSKGKTTLTPASFKREDNLSSGNVNLDGTVTMDEPESVNADGSTVMDSSGEENRSIDDSDSDSWGKTSEKSSQTRYGKMRPKVVLLQKPKTLNEKVKTRTGVIVKTESLKMPLIVKKENFSCDFCDKTFTIQRHLKNHCKKEHDTDIEVNVPVVESELENRVYNCDQCDCSYTRVSSLKKHQRTKHGATFKSTTDKQFTCDVCFIKYDTSHFLELHQADKHGKVETKMSIEHKCKECGETFDKYRALRLHKKQHQSKIKHVCEICGRVFGRGDSLLAHRKFVHLGMKRACQRRSLEKTFVCEICGKRFYRRSNLNEHITNKHSNQPFPHKCDHCDKRFNRPHSLEYHTNKIHLKSKPYKCEKCQKDFYSRHSLHDHKNICSQTLEEKLGCEQCGKLFSTQHNLKLHMQAVHSTPALVCPCGTTVRWQSSVTKHKRRCSLHNSKLLKAKKEPLRYIEQVLDVEDRPTIENGAVVYMHDQCEENQAVGAELVSGLESGATVVVSEAEADVAASVGKLLEAIPGAGIGGAGEQQEVTVVQEEVVEGGEDGSYSNVRVVTEDGPDSKIYYVIHY